MKRSRPRALVVGIAAFALVLSMTGVALAFDSGTNPGTTGPNTITWTGNGATDGVLKTVECPSDDPVPEGIDENSYLHWIITTDGGNAGTDATLHLGTTAGGDDLGDFETTKDSGGAFHFFTPYYTPDTSTLFAFADIDVLSTGGGPWNLNISHGCGSSSSTISTEIHSGQTDDGDPVVIEDGSSIPSGSEVHDSALLEVAPETELPSGSYVTFYFYDDSEEQEDVTCDTSDEGEPGDYVDASDPIDVGGETVGEGANGLVLDPYLAQGPLEAGRYAYRAFFTSGDTDVVLDATSACEPFEVLKGDTQTRTEVHDADDNDVTNGAVEAGSTVHDAAYIDFVVDDEVTDPPFAIGGTVNFYFFTNSECTGDPEETSDPVDVVDGVAEDGLPQTITTPGFYAYRADYNGDDNYNGSEGECEPFRVVQHGKTMGYWGNVNGQAQLVANDAFGANAVTLGINPGNTTRCWVKVDSASKSLTILPNTLNGASLISQCDATNERDSGINANSFNVLLSQTLAISYNIKYITTPGAYAGQTIGLLGCSAVAPLTSSFNGSAGLSATSTVEDVRDYANKLIGHAIKNNGSLTVSQGQIGAMNTLLGCLNAEA